MKKLALAASALCVALLAVSPAHAEPWHHHGHDHVSLSFGYYSGSPYYYPPYPAYAYPVYPAYGYAPPPVVYAQPPAQVIYTQPQTTVIQQAPPTVSADQTSPTFTGPNGQQCREYQSGNTYGTACLQPDGAWRIVQ